MRTNDLELHIGGGERVTMHMDACRCRVILERWTSREGRSVYELSEEEEDALIAFAASVTMARMLRAGRHQCALVRQDGTG